LFFGQQTKSRIFSSIVISSFISLINQQQTSLTSFLILFLLFTKKKNTKTHLTTIIHSHITIIAIIIIIHYLNKNLKSFNNNNDIKKKQVLIKFNQPNQSCKINKKNNFQFSTSLINFKKGGQKTTITNHEKKNIEKYKNKSLFILFYKRKKKN
jgi:hypothetical protein